MMKETDRASLAELDATGQAELVRRGEVSALELVDAAAERLQAVEPLIRAVVHVDVAQARTRAESGLEGPFCGVPFLIKDLAEFPGMPWRMGSRLFSASVGARVSPFVEKVSQSGLLTLGKSATSELGLIGSTETLAHGVTHNPWALTHSAAGSSGGAAAAVAAGLVPLAHASDGGGSIRIPASVCGVFGMLPSRGRVAATRSEPSPLDAWVGEGCISRSVRDTARFLTAVQEPGGPLEALPFVEHPRREPLIIGAWNRTLLGAEPGAEVRLAWEKTVETCRELGHEVRVIDAPSLPGKALGDAFFSLAGATVHQLTRLMETMLGRALRPDELEPLTRSLAALGAGLAEADLAAAHDSATRAARAYLEATRELDVVLTPTLAGAPWLLGTLSPLLDRAELIARTERLVGYTPIQNAAGCPAMSVPLGWSEQGLPLGSHFAAAPGREALLLGLAYQLEAARPWKDHWPPYSYPRLFGRLRSAPANAG